MLAPRSVEGVCMASNPASIADLESRSFRTLTANEKTVGGTLLGDAWAIVLSAKPNVADRLDKLPKDTVFESLVKQTLCAMVLRVLNNPDGKLEERQDDYQYRLDSAVSTGALYLSDAELARLSEGDDVSDGAWTIGPRFASRQKCWTGPDSWV